MSEISQMTANLHRLCHLYFSIISEEMTRFGVTKPQMLVIAQIKDGAKTIGELSKQLDLSYSTVSGIVDRLERDQIVMRKKDEHDRRIVWVSLVDQCCKVEEKVHIFQESYYAEIFQGMSTAEVDNASQALTVINKCLEKKRTALGRERGSERR